MKVFVKHFANQTSINLINLRVFAKLVLSQKPFLNIKWMIKKYSVHLYFVSYDECHLTNISYSEKTSVFAKKIVQCGLIVT